MLIVLRILASIVVCPPLNTLSIPLSVLPIVEMSAALEKAWLLYKCCTYNRENEISTMVLNDIDHLR